MVRPRRRPAGAARVPRAGGLLDAQEGGVGEGDASGEAVALGETGRRRRGGVGVRQELGPSAA
jgi:hypothetical protein